MQRGSLRIKTNSKGAKVWRAQWRELGSSSPRTRILGTYAGMNRAEARAELDRIVCAVNGREAGVARSRHSTVRAYIEDEYLLVKNRKWKDSTRATTEQIIGSHIINELGARSLASVTRKDLQALLDRKAAAGLSGSVIGHVRSELAQIFAMAAADGLIQVNPAGRGSLVMPRLNRVPDRRVENTQAITAAFNALGVREHLIVRLAVCQGMRPGEIVGLQIGDIQPDGLHIERRIYRGKVDVPKSWRGLRVLPLTDETAELLNRYLELLEYRGPTAWLFPSETGTTPLSYSNCYRRNIQPALKRIGMGHVNFQILRRSWVTELGEVEPDARVRAQLAGRGVDVHENAYRQATPAAARRAMDALGCRLG